MNNSYDSALEVFLCQLLQSKEFDQIPNKNWEAISNLFPGTTPYQCQKRYREMKQDPTIERTSMAPKLSASTNKNSTKDKTEGSKESKAAKDASQTKAVSSGTGTNSGDQGPTMVIHVCDEAKSLKQDFFCPRDLLVNEMKYFAEYLSADAQRWEDVDISVHCDVQIFEWLMRYVKRGSKEVPQESKLEVTNVISILISSEFLKMDNLVEMCIEFCYKNMNAIIASPCNMNCINDGLVTRMAAKFSHKEIEELKDRKDKFRNKLFAKKLEKLFDAEVSKNNPDSPENACTLYKCSACQRLLTRTLEKKISCVTSRMLVDNHGGLVYIHNRDLNWDVSDYLVELKTELKNWRDVYWRIWGTINFLYCVRCEQAFQCQEFTGCAYHKDQPIFQADPSLGKLSGSVGTYLCCGQKTMRFDPASKNKGCQVQDHIVQVEEADDGAVKRTKVMDDLLAYRDAILVSTTLALPKAEDLNVFANEEFVTGIREDGIGISKSADLLKQQSKASEFQAPKLQALTHEVYESESFSDKSDDETGDDEVRGTRSTRTKPRQRKMQVTVKPAAILVDGPEFEGHHWNRWDTNRSLRYNQDAQRQEDIIRFREMIDYLTRLRHGTEKLDKYKQKEYAGGIYAKIEAQWRATYLQPKSANLPHALKLRNKQGMKP